MSCPGVVLSCAGQPQRCVVVLGVEIAAHRDGRIRLGVEYALDRKPQLERLSCTLHGGTEEAFRPACDGFPGERTGLLSGYSHGKWGAQMNVHEMEVATAWEGKEEMLKRPIPCERGRRSR